MNMDHLVPTHKNLTASSLAMVLFSVLTGALGQMLFKEAVNSTGALTFTFEALIALFTTPIFLVGLIVFVVSALTWLFALMRVDLSFAYPFLSLSYVIVTLGGSILFEENVTVPRLVGVAVIVCGLLIVAFGESNTAQSTNGTTSSP